MKFFILSFIDFYFLQNLGAFMNTDMDDEIWKTLLTYIFKVEDECMKLKWTRPGHFHQLVRIDLPTIAGVAKDPLISSEMMSKVYELIAM